MITIINYGMGNLRSVEKIFQRLNCNVLITSDVETINKADKLLLPGVGHFEKGVEKLKKTGIWDVLNNKVLVDKTPILGICLGMQLMTKHSHEGNVEGFGWIDAQTEKFNLKSPLKVPHMGWNSINLKKRSSKISLNLDDSSLFYFVHSYYVTCNNEDDILFESNYGHKFVSGFQKNNFLGVQFHPEKSHQTGLQLIKNFINI